MGTMIILALGVVLGVLLLSVVQAAPAFWAAVRDVLAHQLDERARDAAFSDGYRAGKADMRIEQWPQRRRRGA